MTPSSAGALARSLLELAAELAVSAGGLARAGRAAGVDDVETKTTPTDMVTEHDHAAEELIVGRLRAERPDDGIVGEEGTADPGTSGIHWLIDPIDGTTNFLYDLPTYSVSIAACDADGGLVGVVYAPVLDELFTASRHGGAELNGRPIRCSAQRSVGAALVGTGFSYLPERRALQGRRVANLLAEVRDIRRFGSAALDLCYVAAGRLDAYYEQYLNPWDLAAGEIIAREAGANIGSFGGGIGEADGILAAAPAIFDELVRLVEGAGEGTSVVT